MGVRRTRRRADEIEWTAAHEGSNGSYLVILLGGGHVDVPFGEVAGCVPGRRGALLPHLLLHAKGHEEGVARKVLLPGCEDGKRL